MGYKIAWHNPLPKEITSSYHPDFNDVVIPGMQKVADRVARPDTEVVFNPFTRDAESPMNPYYKMACDDNMVENVIQAERAGYDASLIGCYYDPGLMEAKCATDYPVVGVAQSAMLLAQMLGRKFACMTLTDMAVPLLEQNVRLYGLEAWATHRPVRALKVEYPVMWSQLLKAYLGDPQPLIQTFEEAAVVCVEDGADVITTGCVWMGPAFTLAGYREVGNTGVQVVDSFAAGISMLEMMLQLHQSIGVTRSHGDNSLYTTPDQATFMRHRTLLGIGRTDTRKLKVA